MFFFLLLSLPSFLLQWHHEKGNFCPEFDQPNWRFYVGYYSEMSGGCFKCSIDLGTLKYYLRCIMNTNNLIHYLSYLNPFVLRQALELICVLTSQRVGKCFSMLKEIVSKLLVFSQGLWPARGKFVVKDVLASSHPIRVGIKAPVIRISHPSC